ncbi:uncharacterized protein F4807DRAFT_424285 [Annulohypoxylon truncatum]|uniref:uncharacterized protein n=1 Tax=Annulohypoxylon truncatum TaxID=327061 RepID=UPI0020081249|nr:uncharacterized protein F4807DRAFT_424285 [Annulohypoxylon truncatum]KAI1210216.1 hypothetical protein F4807DRAFT_424285 [Annulohypoxylon truncatum]
MGLFGFSDPSLTSRKRLIREGITLLLSFVNIQRRRTASNSTPNTMTRSLRSAVAALCLWGIAGVKGEDGVNKFTYPATDGLLWNYRDTVITSYEGNISAPLLYTFCKDSKGTVEQERLDHVNGPNTTASIILDFVVADPIATCWFNIRLDEPDSPVGANSASFQYNSTEGDRKTFSLAPTSTSATSSPTSSSTQSGVSTTNPAIATTSATTPSASASASHTPGLSPGASAGVGVGVGLVGIAIGAGAALFFYRRSRKRGDDDGQGEIAPTKPELMGSSPYPPSAGGSPNVSVSEYPKSGYYAQVPNNEIHEAPAFQDGVVKSELGAPHGPYNDAAAELEQQKFRGTPPVVARQEMEAAPVIHEMP